MKILPVLLFFIAGAYNAPVESPLVQLIVNINTQPSTDLGKEVPQISTASNLIDNVNELDFGEAIPGAISDIAGNDDILPDIVTAPVEDAISPECNSDDDHGKLEIGVPAEVIIVPDHYFGEHANAPELVNDAVQTNPEVEITDIVEESSVAGEIGFEYTPEEEHFDFVGDDLYIPAQNEGFIVVDENDEIEVEQSVGHDNEESQDNIEVIQDANIDDAAIVNQAQENIIQEVQNIVQEPDLIVSIISGAPLEPILEAQTPEVPEEVVENVQFIQNQGIWEAQPVNILDGGPGAPIFEVPMFNGF